MTVGSRCSNHPVSFVIIFLIDLSINTFKYFNGLESLKSIKFNDLMSLGQFLLKCTNLNTSFCISFATKS